MSKDANALERMLASERAAEQMRRAAAKATEKIVLRAGRELNIWVGCGYPKSGTVWLYQLMGSYLAKPYPQDYRSPIMMSSVIHAHWPYDARLPKSVYIVRDGRDVMVSLYFYNMRMFSIPRSPRRTQALRETYQRLFGPGFDPQDIQTNLPKFIEHEMTERDSLRGQSWAEHVRDWSGHDGVARVRYEDLLADTATELHRVMVELDAPQQDFLFAELAAQRFDFRRASGREAGVEDRSSFMRKGVAGDWRSHFTREAAEVFDAHAGDVLLEAGYESSRDWSQAL